MLTCHVLGPGVVIEKAAADAAKARAMTWDNIMNNEDKRKALRLSHGPRKREFNHGV